MPCTAPAGSTTTKKAPDSTACPNRLHTHTHPSRRLAHPRAPMPPLSTLTARATHARQLHPAALASVSYGVILVRVQKGLAVKETPASEPRLRLGEMEGRGGGCFHFKTNSGSIVFSLRALARCAVLSVRENYARRSLCLIASLGSLRHRRRRRLAELKPNPNTKAPRGGSAGSESRGPPRQARHSHLGPRARRIAAG